MVSVAKDCKVHFPPRFKDRKQSVPIGWSDEIKKSIHLNNFRISGLGMKEGEISLSLERIGLF